jgi:predicted Ser/Thr protein kinase
VAKLGEGGMGVVYRATDTRLERPVAIKVLAAGLAGDREFRERFEREARSISQLNHPHVCTLHDVGTQDGISFLVMEYLEGETLAARLARGPLPLDQTLTYAMEIADALDKAHRRGIVHRDLKPGNVMLTKTGTKLLDFGLAKIAPPVTPGTLETRLATAEPMGPPRAVDAGPLTSQGSLLGTFQYMAPEQIQGQDADARADIWAFGCVLYEMATDKRAFDGKTLASLIAAILEREPRPMADLQPMTPSSLDRLVRTCLAKDPDDRFQTARDVWLQLRWIKEGEPTAATPAHGDARRSNRQNAMWLASAILLAAIAGASAWWLKPALPRETHVVSRLKFTLPDDQTFSRIGRRFVAVSPDGSKVAYVANRQLYLRSLDRLDAEPLRGTNEDPLEPVFSPESREIAYFVPGSGATPGSLRKISVTGGAAQTLCPASQPWGVTWKHGLIAFGQSSAGQNEIDAVSESGGAVRRLVSLGAKEGRAIEPWLDDDGRHLLFVILPPTAAVASTPDDAAEIVWQDLNDGRRTPLIRGGTSPQILPTGHLLYVHDSTLLVAAFDRTRVAVGGPVPVVEGVNETLISWAGQFGVSRTGTLVYSPGRSSGDPRELVWVDRQNREQRIAAPPHAYLHPRVSPDGKKIAVDAVDEESDIWVWHDERLSKLTFGPAAEMYPVWMSDSQHVIFRSLERGAAKPDVFRKSADGTGPLVALTTHASGGEPVSISPNQKSLVIRTSTPTPTNQWSLLVLSLDGGPPTKLLGDQPYSQLNGEISPDGKLIAYDSSESTRNEVYVRPFPDVDAARWQVSTAGGQRPAWSRNGDELYFESGGRLMSVSVRRDPTPTFGQLQLVLDVTPYSLVGGPGRRYDVAPDGRFLFPKPIRTGDPMAQTIIVVSHWFDDLKARVK